MPEKSDSKPERVRSVSYPIAAEMKDAIVVLAGSRSDDDTRESMIARAARRAGITYRQAKAFYYGEADDPRVSVVDRVREALRRHQHSSEVAARADFRELRNQVSILAHRVAALDPDGNRETVAAILGPLAVGVDARGPVDRG